MVYDGPYSSGWPYYVPISHPGVNSKRCTYYRGKSVVEILVCVLYTNILYIIYVNVWHFRPLTVFLRTPSQILDSDIRHWISLSDHLNTGILMLYATGVWLSLLPRKRLSFSHFSNLKLLIPWLIDCRGSYEVGPRGKTKWEESTGGALWGHSRNSCFSALDRLG